MWLLAPFDNQLPIRLPDSMLHTISTWNQPINVMPMDRRLNGGGPYRGKPCVDRDRVWFFRLRRRLNLATRTPRRQRILPGWPSSAVRSFGCHRKMCPAIGTRVYARLRSSAGFGEYWIARGQPPLLAPTRTGTLVLFFSTSAG